MEKKRKPSKRHEERLKAINEARELVRRNSERYYAAQAERERQQGEQPS
jgi:hypothetical protein